MDNAIEERIPQLERLIQATEKKARNELRNAEAVKVYAEAIELQVQTKQNLLDEVRVLISEVKDMCDIVCSTIEHNILRRDMGSIERRLDTMVAVLGQLVSLLPALIRPESSDVLLELRNVQDQMFELMQFAVKRPDLDVQAGGTRIDDIGGDVSGNIAGRDIKRKYHED